MRVLVTGDRSWPRSDYGVICDKLREYQEQAGPNNMMIICGGQRKKDRNGRVSAGVDYCAAMYGLVNEVEVHSIPAAFRKIGVAAGPVRNKLMIAVYEPTVVLAFHSFIPASKGTKSCVTEAMRVGIETHLFNRYGQEYKWDPRMPETVHLMKAS